MRHEAMGGSCFLPSPGRTRDLPLRVRCGAHGRLHTELHAVIDTISKLPDTECSDAGRLHNAPHPQSTLAHKLPNTVYAHTTWLQTGCTIDDTAINAHPQPAQSSINMACELTRQWVSDIDTFPQNCPTRYLRMEGACWKGTKGTRRGTEATHARPAINSDWFILLVGCMKKGTRGQL
jgi:hypothetical protein